jgi:hypothetical protein
MPNTYQGNNLLWVFELSKKYTVLEKCVLFKFWGSVMRIVTTGIKNLRILI